MEERKEGVGEEVESCGGPVQRGLLLVTQTVGTLEPRIQATSACPVSGASSAVKVRPPRMP